MKLMRFAAAAITAISLLAGPVAAQQQISTLTLTGEGVVNASPDIATVQVGVAITGKVAKDALLENSKLLTAALNAAKENGIEPRDLQTSGISLTPDVTRPNDYQSVRIVGYRVNNMLSIRIRDLEKLGGLLDRLVVIGANDIRSVTFSVANPTPLIEQARIAAIKDAVRKAEIYAEAANLKIVRVISISDSGIDFPRPQQRVRTLAASPERVDVPVEAGEQAFTARVGAVFEIAPK